MKYEMVPLPKDDDEVVSPINWEEKIKRAKNTEFEDITFEELKKEWLELSSEVAKTPNPSPEMKERAKQAKEKYLQELHRRGISEKK